MSQSPLNTGRDVRRACRSGRWTAPTAALAPGFAQANLVVLPREYASDFMLFCERNPQACPLLEVCEVENQRPLKLAPEADLRTDLPRYRVWEEGRLVDEPTDVRGLWRDDLVSLLIGCSFTFDTALRRAGLPVRHLEQGRNVPMYRTSIPCISVGVFGGPLVVSMRPFTQAAGEIARQVTAGFARFHGAPIHFGDPGQIGIADLSRPDFGDPVEIREGEFPVFWACGVTPQCALMNARLPIAITHAPGHMFVTDVTNESLLPS